MTCRGEAQTQEAVPVTAPEPPADSLTTVDHSGNGDGIHQANYAFGCLFPIMALKKQLLFCFLK